MGKNTALKLCIIIKHQNISRIILIFYLNFLPIKLNEFKKNTFKFFRFF